MFFEKVYKPLPLVFNLVLAMLWRHPENIDVEKVKVAHYCAAVSTLSHSKFVKSKIVHKIKF